MTGDTLHEGLRSPVDENWTITAEFHPKNRVQRVWIQSVEKGKVRALRWICPSPSAGAAGLPPRQCGPKISEPIPKRLSRELENEVSHRPKKQRDDDKSIECDRPPFEHGHVAF